MSSILHFDNVLINPCLILHGSSVHRCKKQNQVSCSLLLSNLLPRQSQFLVCEIGISKGKHQRSLAHIPFGYTTQSRAGLGIVSVHEWHHHKHSQSRHVDTPVGFCNGLNTGMCVSLASAFKRTKSENTSFAEHAEFHRSQVPSFFGSLLHKNR